MNIILGAIGIDPQNSCRASVPVSNLRAFTLFCDRPREESRFKDIIYKLSMFKPLGYFHSHPECDPTPTKDDVQSMKINDIELIVTIEKKGRNVPWRYDASKKLLAGVLGEFRFELAAYTRTKSKSPTVKKLDLLCPFALGIGSKYFDTQVKPPE